MKKMLAVTTNAGDVLLTILAIAIGIALLVLLFFAVKKERLRFLEVGKNKNILTFSQFEKYITSKILSATKRTEFVVAKIELHNFEETKKSLGETQFAYLEKELFGRLFACYGIGSKVSSDLKGSYYIFIRFENRFEDLSHIAETLEKKFSEQVVFSATFKVDIDSNLSITSFPFGGSNFQEIMQNLEIAIVKAKRSGNNQFALYNDSLKNMESSEYKYYEEIKAGINQKQFVFFYQPCINIDNGEVFFGESLLRWDNPEKGILSPDKFLNIMEQTGDIIWVGNWSFEQMAKEYSSWQANYSDHKFSISINLSGKELANADIVEDMKKTCRKNKILPENFILELQSADLFSNYNIIKENLIKLKQASFKLLIDNLDLNLSAIEKIQEVKFDMLKIKYDYIKKAISSEITEQILKATIDICKKENIEVVAEGIETKEDVENLSKYSIKLAQGYLFAKPKNHSEFISDVVMTPWLDQIESLNTDKKEKK